MGATSDEAELAANIAAGGRVGELYAALRDLRDEYAGLVRTRFPKIPRRVSGYNLDELLPEAGFHVARALVGSEGTCAIVLNATLRLVESPPHRTLVGIGVQDIFIAADHVPQLLQFPLIGLEGLDCTLTDALRRKGKLLTDLELLPAGGGFLLAEFGGATRAESDAQAQALIDALETWQSRHRRHAFTPWPRLSASGTSVRPAWARRPSCPAKAPVGRVGKTRRSSPHSWAAICASLRR